MEPMFFPSRKKFYYVFHRSRGETAGARSLAMFVWFAAPRKVRRIEPSTE
jgi:hypothetical protein